MLAQTQPGGRATERRLKQHGATRRCEVCKAAGAYESGELTAPEALTRAGWDRSSPVQRSVLLDIFGLPEPPELPAADAAEAPSGPPAAAPQAHVPAARPERWRWPGQPARQSVPGPEIDALVDALIQSWTAASQAGARPPPEPQLEAGL